MSLEHGVSLPEGSSTVLSYSELGRIRGLARQSTGPAVVTSDEVDAHREKLHALSKARVKKWGNTIEAQRRNKDAHRQELADIEEKRRCKIDAEEARFKAAERSAAIQRANTILYNQNDRVKVLNSRLLLSDVLQERESQIGLSKDITQMAKDEEQMYYEQEIRLIKEAEVAETRVREKRQEKVAAAAKVQLEQLQLVKDDIIQERREEREEGMLIKAKVEAEIEAESKKETKLRIEAREQAKVTRTANEKLLQARREKEIERAAEEEAKIEAYAEERDRYMEERKRREAEKEAEKQMHRDRMSKLMERNLEAEREAAGERLSMQMKELEDNKEAEEAARVAKHVRLVAEMKLSHTEQLELKALEDQVRAEEEEVLCKQTAFANEAAAVAESEAKQEVREASQRLEHYHVKQIGSKVRKKERDEATARLEAKQALFMLEEEDAKFEKYSADLVSAWAAQGKDTRFLDIKPKK